MPESKTKKKTGDGSARTKKTTTKAKAVEAPAEKPKTTRRTTRTSAKKEQGAAVAAPAVNAQIAEQQAAQPAPQQFWRRMDIHMHTLGSHDYEQPTKTYLDILQQAERRGLDIIAFTDHNTVNGYRAMRRQIEDLELLERLGRINPDEQGKLDEYRRLLSKILVLPGFEFTATFGFHILGVFSPDKSAREIEQCLVQLRVPSKVIDEGLTEAGATSDVLAAYQVINQAGGIAIAAHANSSNGVSMRNMNLGGQTRIAFTQDPFLHALEFTDLDKGRYSSGRLFTAVRAEYPRRMHLVQGSDAHRVVADPSNPKRLGVGDRVTEVWLEKVSFEELRKLLSSQDFDKVRPTFAAWQPKADPVRDAREAGAGPMRAFYPALPKRGDVYADVLKDVCAMSNADGGVIFIGCGDIKQKKTPGVTDPEATRRELSAVLVKRISPAVKAGLETHYTDGAPVLCVIVHPDNKNKPFALDEAYFVRDGAESRAANRADLIAIVRGMVLAEVAEQERHAKPQPPPPQPQAQPQHNQRQHQERNERRPQEPRKQQPQAQVNNQGGQPRQQQQAQADGRPTRQPLRSSRHQQQPQPPVPTAQPAPQPAPQEQAAPPAEPIPQNGQNNGPMPHTGVEVVSADERDGVRYFTVRDLRKGNVVPNVTLASARDLWHYAVRQTIDGTYTPDKIEWTGDRAVLSKGERAGKLRYDLAMRNEAGDTRVFFGVTEDGLDESWKSLLEHAHQNEPVAGEDGE
ncbi:MAG TPA: putative DNA binding domain-containing protein [Thermoflexales bacterium]|nr:putative DNA binding domain-containing protein [Thermoflexales bacterium]